MARRQLLVKTFDSITVEFIATRKLFFQYDFPEWWSVSNIFTFENDSSEPNTPKPEKVKKKFWSLSNLFIKTRLGSHNSEKTEFFRLMQREKLTIVTSNSNQPSHAKATLTRSQKGLVSSPLWGT